MSALPMPNLLLSIDRNDALPIHAQIVAGVRGRIEEGGLGVGDELPSTRRLGERLGVHRSTVALAYQELWSLGFLELRPGARPRVRARRILEREGEEPAAEGIDWTTRVTGGVEEVWRRHLALPVRSPAKRDEAMPIGFASLDPDPRLFPLDRFRSCVRSVLQRAGDELFGYGDPRGYRPLREYVARRVAQHGMRIDADEILLTHGSQHACDLVLRALVAPGDRVAVEAPTYDHLLPLLAAHGAVVREIPLRADGVDLEALGELLERERPALLYTMPSFQNPSGISTTQAHRERLLAWCEEHDVPLLEDGYEEEMRYTGPSVLAIKAIDRRGLVIYAGTFSKVLFPGLRIGWLAAAPKLIERLTALRRFTDIAPNAILPAALYEFCRRGEYDRHLNRMHRAYRRRMGTALRTLEERIDPRVATWTTPAGGYLLWLKLRRGPIEGGELAAACAARGVEVLTGRSFFASSRGARYLRLSISARDEKEIEEGIERLAAALRDVAGRFTGSRK